MPSIFPQTKFEHREFELSMERRKTRQNKKAMMEKARLKFVQSYGEKVAGQSTRLTTFSLGVPAEASLVKFTQIVLPPHANHMVFFITC
jgi:hypothetical protein